MDDLAQLRQEVESLWWYHNIDLGHGVVTPGVDNTPRKLKKLKFPESFKGKTVLDIGAFDGFFSFEAERRGAERVLATDCLVWEGGHYRASKKGFELARRVLNSKVED